jgi:hypothetical protein
LLPVWPDWAQFRSFGWYFFALGAIFYCLLRITKNYP